MSTTLLQVFPNKRRKTPLITMPYTKEAYVFYKTNHPGWIVELDTKRSNRKENNNEKLR